MRINAPLTAGLVLLLFSACKKNNGSNNGSSNSNKPKKYIEADLSAGYNEFDTTYITWDNSGRITELNGTLEKYTYAYQFDTQGRLTMETDSQDNGITIIREYFY